MTAKISFKILQNQKHQGELNPGLPGKKQMSYHLTMDSFVIN